MKRLRILQIGDIHYPWCMSKEPTVDRGGSPDIITNVTDRLGRGGIALNKLANTVDQICDPRPDVIAFMGDFTVAGDAAGMDAAFQFAREKIVRPLLSQSEASSRVICVPGNHDILRPQTPTDDFRRKFDSYVEIATRYGFQNNSASLFGECSIPTARGSLKVLGINTCIGCGEFRSLPEPASRQLRQLDGITEQLDIPLLDRTDVDGLDVQLTGRSGPTLAVVVGHHNLLPQREPRVRAYGELLNSGVLRELLSTKTRPLIYLHGHIHNDTIELVRDPAHKEGGVLCISAPLLSDGLNVVDVYHDDFDDVVGVDVIPWRLTANMNLQPQRSVRIPLGYGEHRLAQLPEESQTIFNYLIEAGGAAHRHVTKLARHLGLTEEATAEFCEALSWAGLVSIAHFHKTPAKWDVRLAI